MGRSKLWVTTGGYTIKTPKFIGVFGILANLRGYNFLWIIWGLTNYFLYDILLSQQNEIEDRL
jgi:hypothetical protein